MHIKFHGHHTTNEAVDSIAGILKLFAERYGIQDFNDLDLDLTLENAQGEKLELKDMDRDQVLDVFEVYKTIKDVDLIPNSPHLKLVVDNT